MTSNNKTNRTVGKNMDRIMNVSIERLIRSANFRYKAYMEKIDYTIKTEP